MVVETGCDKMFCPKCDSMMTPSKNEWVCTSCGYKQNIDEKDKKETITEKAKEKELIVITENEETMPIDEHAKCPECKNSGAYWVMLQTRSADEPETRIYTCTECGKRWREY